MYDRAIELEGMYSLVYWFLCLCFVVPPREVAHAGITIQNLFGRFLGHERIDFIKYHTKRASLTLFIHSLLPIGYVFVLMTANIDKYLFGFYDLPYLIQIGYASALSVPIASFVCIFLWSRNNWSYHPLTLKLRQLLPGEVTVSSETVAGAINMEMRRTDLFNSGHYSQKVHVTDNWIIKVGTYNLDIVHQSNCVLSLHGSEEFTLTEESPHGVQILQIDVRPVDKSLNPFVIRLKSTDYRELKDKLHAPLVNARNVVVKETVTEMFVNAFSEAVDSNIRYMFNSTEAGYELESCLGCMQTPANAKLVKLCHAVEEGDCQQCFCRPLWCISCLAKWFCSKQDQNDTSAWLSSTAGCPMCRAKFCMADVCMIDAVS